MSQRITVDPMTRIEGHLRVDCEVDNGKVVKAWSSGQMWRGIELILQGRDPRDAIFIPSRACGVCGEASLEALRLRGCAAPSPGPEVSTQFLAMLPDRLRARTQAEARFFEVGIPVGSAADGRPVSEFPWPDGCLLVSINRGSDLLIPSGSTILQAGDAITAFGGDGPRDRLAERLAVGADPDLPG